MSNTSLLLDQFLKDPEAAIRNPKNINVFDEDHINLPCLVASYGKTELVTLMTQLGYDLNMEGYYLPPIGHEGKLFAHYYSTPVHIAIRAGHLDTAKKFYECGANVNKRIGEDPDSNYRKIISPIVKHTFTEQLEVVYFLFNELHADVNSSDENGRTPLLEAVVSNKPELCAFLLQKGANLNAQESYGNDYLESGRTPFLSAVYFNHVKIIALFIQSGKVDYSKTLSNGRGAWELASPYIRAMIQEDPQWWAFKGERIPLYAEACEELPTEQITQKITTQENFSIEELIEKTNSRYFEKEHFEALSLNDIAMQQEPANSELHQERARIYIKMSAYKCALKYLSKAIELLLPDVDTSLLEQRAQVLIKLRAYPDAISDLSKVIDIKKNTFNFKGSTFRTRGTAYYKNGQLREAVMDFLEAKKIDKISYRELQTREEYYYYRLAKIGMGEPWTYNSIDEYHNWYSHFIENQE